MKEVITYATTVKLSNQACNRAWEDGCIVVKNILNDMDTLYDLIKKYDTVYMEYIDEFGRGYDDLSPILQDMRMHNITIKLRDWELDPMYNGYDCVVKTLRDTKEYSKVLVSRYIAEGMVESETYNHCKKKGRKKRRLPMTEICRLRRKGMGWSTIAQKVDVPYTTLYGRRKDVELNIDMGVGL